MEKMEQTADRKRHAVADESVRTCDFDMEDFVRVSERVPALFQPLERSRRVDTQ